MKIGMKLPIDARYFYFKQLPEVMAEADKIAKNTDERRPPEVKYRDALRGLALQYAFAEWLVSLGFTVEIAPRTDWWYDLIVNGILVDTKGRFEGSWYSQTVNERNALRIKKLEVLYIAIDATNEAGFTYAGENWGSKLTPGSGGSAYFRFDDFREDILLPG
jgi:hypothetical protein